MYKKVLFFITGSLLFLSSFSAHTSAFLGEDLGLDLYKNIDEGFEQLEIKQYQYEISGQGGGVADHVNSILEINGIECEISDIEDIELIAGASSNQIQEVFDKCKNSEVENMTTLQVANVIDEVKRVKASLERRAEEKSRQIYDISRIGLYSDGISENSPFDLITDIEEIDRIIFSEEIEYIGEDYGSLDFSDEVDDYIEGNDRIADASYNAIDEDIVDDADSEDDIDSTDSEDGDVEDTIRDTLEPLDENGNPIITTEDGHVYACYEDRDESGFDENTLNWLTSDIYISGGTLESLYTRTQEGGSVSLSDIDNRTRGRLGTPIESRDLEAKTRFGPDGLHTAVYDSWQCDNFFCITIGFIVKQQNLLAAGGGGKTASIQSVLEKAGEHLYHFTTTSLVQSKMTTNNFEIGLVIPNLGDMLRGFGIQIQSKPTPILNIDNSEKEKESNIEGDVFSRKNLLVTYYKNLGLDYSRANDLHLYQDKISEIKALQDSAELSTTETVNKLEVYKDFKDSLEKENEILSQTIDNKMMQDDLQDFYTQFLEIERFALSMHDFTLGVSGAITEMEKIPTQKP